jgi:hypothetical protein
MRNSLTAVLAILTIGLFSCQKEVDDVFKSSGGGSANSGLLKKVVTLNGTDSTVFTIGYNSSSKITSVYTSGVGSGTTINTQESFIRNNQGIVTQIITKDADYAAYGIDSIITIVNSVGGKYTSRVSNINLLGLLFKDSVAFTYSGSTIIKEEDFLDVGIGTGYAPTTKNEFTYTGNNITAIKVSVYDDASSSYQDDYTQTFTYDTKASPLILGVEGIAIGYYNWYSSNNVVKLVAVSSTDPTQNETQTVTYTYNSSNRPLTAITAVQGGPTFNSTYSYY